MWTQAKFWLLKHLLNSTTDLKQKQQFNDQAEQIFNQLTLDQQRAILRKQARDFLKRNE